MTAAGGAVLATGGAGFVGAHVVADLAAAGRPVVVLDDFSNAPRDIATRLAALGASGVTVVAGDVRDADLLDRVITGHRVAAVVHLAGLKSVAESVAEPLAYFDVNLGGAVVLLEAMRRNGVRRLVFSSSATVYGVPATTPIAESAPLAPVNPYGRSKAMIEAVLADLAAAEPGFAALSLRYFNPVGAHASGLIGESPTGPPANLFPIVSRAAAGLIERVRVYGTDYPTPDGTGVRDYVHVSDLARGHRTALDFLEAGEADGRHLAVNLGVGRGASVLEAIAAFERVTGRRVPVERVGRRPGDVAECIADPGLAARLLGWRAERDLDAMCADAWRFQERELARNGAR